MAHARPALDPDRVYEFGGFSFHLGTGLSKEGALVCLSPKMEGILAVLLQAEGGTVDKNMLIDAVWGSPASDDSLFRAVAGLRSALHDHKPHGIVQSRPGRGYRIGVTVRSDIHGMPVLPRNTHPEDAPALCRTAFGYLSVHSARNAARVRELLDRAIEADPTSREALELMCSLEVANGLRWLRPPEQAFEDARSAARKLLEFDRVNAIALATMGFVRGVLDRDLESALVLSDAAFAKAPASVGPLCFTRAWSLAANGKLMLAIDVLESGIKTNGHDRGLYATLGLFLYFAHRYREAREALEDHVMNVSPFSSCWAVLALVHSAEGNFERALSCAEKAAASDDSCPTIASSLASVLAAMGHSAEAEAKLTDLLHEPVQAAPSLLAPIFALLGQRDRMMSALTQAVRQKCPYHPLIGKDPRLM